MSRTKSPARPGIVQALAAVILAAATAGAVNAESSSIAASVRVQPLEITLDLSSATARVGDTVRAGATVTNVGPTRVSNVTIELRLDATGLGVRGGLTTLIARLQPGRSTTVSWNLCARQAGSYLILARATIDGVAVESEARLLTVSGQRKRGCA